MFIAKTYYSFKYGTFSVDELVANAKSFGLDQLCLADINNTSAMFNFTRACRSAGICPVMGMEIRSGTRLLFTAVARNREGFREINEYWTAHQASGEPLPAAAPPFHQVFVIYPLATWREISLKENEFFGVRPEEVNTLIQYPGKVLRRCVIQKNVTFPDTQSFGVHRLLRAVDLNIVWSRLSPRDIAHPGETFEDPLRLEAKYASYPQIIANTHTLAKACSFDFDLTGFKNKRIFTSSFADDITLLEKLAWDGMYYRYGRQNTEAIARIKKELDIISKMEYGGYFLIAWDIIRYSQSRGYYHVGRGSGANSIIAYCLQLTDVDPIELDLYFERFINTSRSSPPDFDLDFSWDERNEIQDYIFKRHGKDHVSLLATYNTFSRKSVIRELGKVFGLPKHEIDQLVVKGALKREDKITGLIIKYGKLIEEFPNYLSIHAGGVLVSEEPITYFSALNMMPKGFMTVQFDMYVAEDMGYAKFDILSQRGLAHIKEAVELVKRNKQINVDIHATQEFKKDEKVREQIKAADTVGCFYIESPAMRQLLTKLRCDNYITLVAASSIIRPGVSSSGMMKAYIERFHNPNGFDYIHPKMKELLEETYGVMVYQEDVIKVAHHFAGITQTEADVLRRGMSGKSRSKGEMERIKEKFFSNCDGYGYDPAITAEVWRQIESFSGYSFSKAHSASYAVESYQSLYLKTYYPHEFMVGVINNFGGFYNTEFYIHEARRSGAHVQGIHINKSDLYASIEGSTIYLGFGMCKGLESKLIGRILKERSAHGQFRSFDDFLRRVNASLEQVIMLVRLKAFADLSENKKELLWKAHLFFNKSVRVPVAPEIFEIDLPSYQFPVLDNSLLEDVYDEIDLLSYPLSMSPFQLIALEEFPLTVASDMKPNIGKVIKILGYFVCYKPVQTKYGDLMCFGHFIDLSGEFFDTVHFPPSLKVYPFKGRGVYLMEGKVVEEFGVFAVEVQRMAKVPFIPDPRY